MINQNHSISNGKNYDFKLENEMSSRRLLGLPMKTKSVICLHLHCLTPAAFAVFVFICLTWLIFEIPYILPAKPGQSKKYGPYILFPRNPHQTVIFGSHLSRKHVILEGTGERMIGGDHKNGSNVISSKGQHRTRFSTEKIINNEPPPFLWSSRLSRNVSSYIRPGKPTLLLSPTVKCSPSTEVVFVVPSSVNNTQKRDVIRETWGLWVNNKTTRSREFVSKEMKLVFILGKDEAWQPNEIVHHILEESKVYGDIILEDFVDSYLNLTLKSIFMLKWVDMHCPDVNFIMKADDDMFINVLNLEKALNAKNLVKSHLLMGTLICNARPIQNRWSKWYSPSYMFSGKYPNYLSGTSYVISGDLVHKLLNTAIQTPYFHLEDVYITGMCAKKLGVRPVNHRAFTYLKRAFNPCVYKDIITGHEVTPLQMKNLWNMLHNKKIMSNCKPIASKVLYPTVTKRCVWTK